MWRVAPGSGGAAGSAARRAFALLLLVGALAPAHARAQAEGAAAPPPEPSPLRAAIDAGNYFFARLFEERDATAIAHLYTDDGRVIAPGAPPAEGRAAIAAFWSAAFADTKSVRLETLSVEGEGGFAYEDGVVHLVAHDGSETSARYVVVWKRVGRRWYLHRDIWNAGPLAAAPAGAPGAPEAPGEPPEPGAPAPTEEPPAPAPAPP